MADLTASAAAFIVAGIRIGREVMVNIFETMEKTSRRIELFHSQFLADALYTNIGGDRSLFNAVWRLVAPEVWEAPERADINAEEFVPGQGRIDIAIRCDSPERRILGIEVKTTDSSVESGQLEQYWNGLAEKFPRHAIAIAYLTPFNRKWAMDKADDLATVREFDGFQAKYPDARDISWLDIAAVLWNGNKFWRQHRLYVYLHLSPLTKLCPSTEILAALWGDLSELGIPVGGWRLSRQRSNGVG